MGNPWKYHNFSKSNLDDLWDIIHGKTNKITFVLNTVSYRSLKTFFLKLGCISNTHIYIYAHIYTFTTFMLLALSFKYF